MTKPTSPRLTDEEMSGVKFDMQSPWGLVDRYTVGKAIIQAQLKKILEWGNEPCPHRAHNAKYFRPRFACGKCIKELSKEVGE